MAKRKSITGIKRKKTAKQTSALTVANAPDAIEDGTESVRDNLMNERGPRQLLHLRGSGRPRVQSRVAKRAPRNLKPFVKHVSQKTIHTKWGTLNELAQTAIQRQLLRLQLPVLANFNSEQTKSEAQELLRSIRASLFKRLPKTPFPPKTGEKSFDYEGLIKDNRELRQRVNDATAAVSQLKHSLESERGALERQRNEADALEASLGDEEAKLAESRYLSPLSERTDIKDLPASIGLVERFFSG